MDNSGEQSPDFDEALRNEHRRVWTMLPWVANATISAEQKSQVEAHIERCADCREELEIQRALRNAVQAQEPTAWTDPETGLSKLLGRIDEPLVEQPLPTTTPQRKRSPLIAAMAAAIFVQAIGIGLLSVRRPGPGKDPQYITLSQPQALLPTASLRVVPAPSLTMAAWQELLRSNRLHVVGGPNTVGAYELAVETPSRAGVDSLAARLRENADLEFVEALPVQEQAPAASPVQQK